MLEQEIKERPAPHYPVGSKIEEGKLCDKLPTQVAIEGIWKRIRKGMEDIESSNAGIEVTLTCAAADVLTLDPGGETRETTTGGLMLPGRIELLEQCFRKEERLSSACKKAEPPSLMSG